MADNNQTEEQDLLFTVENNNYWFLVQVLFCLVAIIFLASLFFIVASSDIEKGVTHSYSEFFISQLTNGRFLLINILLFVVIPIGLWIEYKKSKQKDNVIYFFSDSIKTNNLSIPIENIQTINIGCCILPKGNLFRYFFVFIIMGFIFIPFTILELLMVIFIQITKHSKITNLSYKFAIQHNFDNHGLIVGYCVDKASKQKLIEFKNKLNHREK
jgi:hypothetical protein